MNQINNEIIPIFSGYSVPYDCEVNEYISSQTISEINGWGPVADTALEYNLAVINDIAIKSKILILEFP